MDKKQEVPFDQWTEVTDDALAAKGRRAFVYRPSNYYGARAIDAFITKEISDQIGTPIVLTKEEAKIIWRDKHDN